jgi:hypothetical protein
MILTSASIIALMLGRRRMSASECIDTYLDMSEKLFGQSQGFTHREKFNPEALERVVKEIVKRKTGKENMPLIYRTCCKTQASRYTQIEPVLELTRSGFLRVRKECAWGSPVLLRTYPSASAPIDCTIWEAARATSAAPTFFPPIKFRNRTGR